MESAGWVRWVMCRSSAVGEKSTTFEQGGKVTGCISFRQISPGNKSKASNMTDAHDEKSQRPRDGSKKRATAEGKLVETTNTMSASDFFSKHEPLALTSALLDDHPGLKRCQGNAKNIPQGYLEECLKLIEQTSAQDYQSSEMKWSSSKKRREMKLPDMKYIILTEMDTSQVAGFISFMVTYEDGHEVLYIYEIHFSPEWQGKGLGKKVLTVVEVIAQNVGVEKVMLTVFRANHRAVDWYTRLDYQADEFSPAPRKLRNGALKEPSYIILSKNLER